MSQPWLQGSAGIVAAATLAVRFDIGHAEHAACQLKMPCPLDLMKERIMADHVPDVGAPDPELKTDN